MKFNIFMIGWEYPPHITGGLGIACRGLARSLANQNVNIQMMLPKIYGDEEQIPGINLFDIHSMSEIITSEEREHLQKLEIYKTRMNWTDKIPSAYQIHGEDPKLIIQSDSHLNEALSKNTITSKTAQEHQKIQIGGYTDRIYWEIEYYAAWAAAYAAALKFDIIHCHDWMTFPAGMAAARRTGKPLVCHVHATEIDRSGDNVNQRIYDLERAAFHACDKVISVSNFTKQILIERYAVPAEKINPVHNGIEYEYNLPSVKAENRCISKEEKLVLFLGRITFQKGPDYFVMAAKKVIERMENVRFVMAGTGDMYHRMIELAADIGIGSYFHYTGFLSKKDASRLYKESDLYVMPSVSEPFGLSPLEAMLHETPVIISRQSGVSEVISNCIKVDFWNVDELAEAILHVLQNKSLHEELTQNGHREAKRLSWDDAAQKTKGIYASIQTETLNY